MSRHPEEVNGVFWVSSNEPVEVVLEGTDICIKKDFGGYYLVHKDDLKAMLKMIEEKTNDNR